MLLPSRGGREDCGHAALAAAAVCGQLEKTQQRRRLEPTVPPSSSSSLTPLPCATATAHRPTAHTAPKTTNQVLLFCGWRALSLLHECSVANMDGCVRGWPGVPMRRYVVRYYNAELGWYLHLMLKHALGAPAGGGRR